jgi:hypothetical protein
MSEEFKEPAGGLVAVERSQFMPALSIELAVERYGAVTEFVSRVLRKDVDYGVIPGTEKRTLLKPGAEKLTTFFGLSTRFQLLERIEDWTGERHGGEPFFYYLYRCQLHRGDLLVAESDGSCNSRETKYRWRESKRLCPACSQPAIIKGREEYGGGWICFKKQGGCGAKYRDGDAAIESQPTGRVANPDIADQVNTIQKMAQKRCLGSTTPVFIRTSRGVSRTDLDELYAIYSNGREDLYLPGVDGSWRQVMGMIRDEGRTVYRINLADGSHLRATGEHRFPTTVGLKHVEELRAGDCLLRSTVVLDGETEPADADFGWVAGLFIAEGHYDRKGVKFTLHQEEVDLAFKIKSIAARVGSRAHIHPRPKTLTLDVSVKGPAFRGLIEQFVDGAGSHGKHLSKTAWRQGAEFLRSLLTGYLQGDGCWTVREGRQPYWRIGFTGKNFDLAHDLRALCGVLGARINLKRASSKCKGVEFPTFVGWIKESAPKYNQKELDEIVSVEKETKPAVVYDIEVDGDHLFCLANGIQTHNSLIAAVLIAVNASEFFTQDMEDFREAAPAAAAPASPANGAEAEISAACRELGKTEEQLAVWLRKKFGAERVEQLTESDKREVLSVLQGMLAKRAA